MKNEIAFDKNTNPGSTGEDKMDVNASKSFSI